MANLIIDIGNTALKAAWAEGLTLGKTYRYQGEKAVDFILTITEKVKPEVMVVSSVRELSQKEINKLERECGRLIRMDFSNTDQHVKYGLPTYLTPDRVASIIAVRHLFSEKSATIFDFGTTLTIDFVGSDGSYQGGCISPGCTTRFKSINRYSKSLPLIQTPENLENLGLSVGDSIALGVVKGVIYEIEGYLKQYPDNVAVFTGGDAIYFAKLMKNSIFVACNAVLIGLAIIAQA